GGIPPSTGASIPLARALRSSASRHLIIGPINDPRITNLLTQRSNIDPVMFVTADASQKIQRHTATTAAATAPNMRAAMQMNTTHLVSPTVTCSLGSDIPTPPRR